MTGEISYDLVMTDDMDFAEGAYRVAGGEWRVFVVRRRAVAEPATKPTTWDSGVSGVVIDLPSTTRLDKSVVERLLSGQCGVSEWSEARGPDSMSLR